VTRVKVANAPESKKAAALPKALRSAVRAKNF